MYSFYPHNQEELIGTNGMESMRHPFLDARVIVVLYRELWGDTPWTGVELQAITDRCLKEQFRPLVFVQLHKAEPTPTWLPSTHIRCVLDDFGIEQLAGAIKTRVQELGGTVKPRDARSEAKRVKAEADYLQDRDRMLNDQRWIMEIVHPGIEQAMQEIVALADELRADGLDIRAGAGKKECVIRGDNTFACVSCNWWQQYTNTVADRHGRSALRVVQLNGALPFPGERAYAIFDPKVLAEFYFKVDVARDRSLVWILEGKYEHIAPDQLADHIVQIYLDLLSRVNRGEVKRPSDPY